MSNYKVAVQLNYFDDMGIDCGEDYVVMEYNRLPLEGGNIRSITYNTHEKLRNMPKELAIRLHMDYNGVLHLIIPDQNKFAVVRQVDLTEPNLSLFRANTPFMAYDKENNEGRTSFLHGLKMYNTDVIRPEDVHYIGYKCMDPVGEFAIACTCSATINSTLIKDEQCWAVVMFKAVLDQAAPPVVPNRSAGGKIPTAVPAVSARALPYPKPPPRMEVISVDEEYDVAPMNVPQLKVPPLRAFEAPRSALSTFKLPNNIRPAEVSLLDDALKKLKAIQTGAFDLAKKGDGGFGH